MKKASDLTAKTDVSLDTADSDRLSLESASPSTSNVFEEARSYLVQSSLAYLLTDARLLSDTGYTPFTFEEVRIENKPQGISNADIFGNIIAILRAEGRGEKEGLAGKNMYKDQADAGLLNALETYIELSLEDKGDPVHMCAVTEVPMQSLIDQHQHAGSCSQCLCAKFGLHHMQVMIDHLVRTEDEKREKEKAESALRGPDPNTLVQSYHQFISAPPLREATEEQLKEDEKINSLLKADMVSALLKELRPGSFLEACLNCPSRTLRTNDKHPNKECVYSISANKEDKTVIVAFRGTANAENWAANLQGLIVKRHNPIAEPYDGKEDYILFHEGFSAYLLRQRLDNQSTKFDEISDAVFDVGNKEIGQGKYRIIVTGHSMGGSLATIFGFYASADSRFTGDDSRPPVDVFTFAAPWVGGMLFFEAFRHQELSRKIRLVRFANGRDFVPHCPPNLAWHERGTTYIHVGVGITLREKPGELPVIGYNSNYKNFWSMFFMRIWEFFLWRALVFKMQYHVITGLVSTMEDGMKALHKEGKSLPNLSCLYEDYVYKVPGAKKMKEE